MENLANKWAGRIYGTNTGNVFVELEQDGEHIHGRLRIMDSVFGVSVYRYTGKVGDEIIFYCKPESTQEGSLHGDVTVKGMLTLNGKLEGDWESTIGTAGTFVLYPHERTEPLENSYSVNPEQVHNKTIQLGSLRLFKDDVLQLINFLKRDFAAGRVIVTYTQRGSELTKYADDFFDQIEGVETLNYLKLVIQEPEAYGINRVIIVELAANGISAIRVSGINDSWVLGKAESIYQILKPKQNFLVTSYRKYGLNLNGAIFIAMLVFLPEIQEVKDRGIFVLLVFSLLTFLLYIHNKLIPNTAIYLEQTKPGLLMRAWPSILSWFIAVTSSLVAAYLYSILKNGGF